MTSPTHPARQLVPLAAVAVLARMVALFWVGGPFVGHIAAVEVAAGAATALAAAAIGARLGGGWIGPGMLAACAPLAVLPGLPTVATLGVATAAAGVALAWTRAPVLGALLAGASVAFDGAGLPLAALVLAVPLLHPAAEARRGLVGLGIGLFVGVAAARLPLLSPMSPSDGMRACMASAQGLDPVGAVERLWHMPAWTGHPWVGALAVLAVVLGQGKQRLARTLVLALALAGNFAVALALGDCFRPTWIAPSALALTALAGCSLTRVPWVGLVALWPAFAATSALGQLRAHEEGGGHVPDVLWPEQIDAEPMYTALSICGLDELDTLAHRLEQTLQPGARVTVMALRDGREQRLVAALDDAREDLRIEVMHGDCCPRATAECADRLQTWLSLGGTWVGPVSAPSCTTPLLAAEDAELAHAMTDVVGPGRVVGYWTWHAGSAPGSACDATRGSVAPVEQ